MRAAGKQSHHWCNVEYRCYVNTMPIRSIRLTIWFTFLLIFLCRYWSRSLLCAHRSMEWLAFPPRKHFNGMSAWARSRNLCACNNIVSRIDDNTDHLINSFSHRPEFFATTFLHFITGSISQPSICIRYSIVDVALFTAAFSNLSAV